jgi:hypothetical protein
MTIPKRARHDADSNPTTDGRSPVTVTEKHSAVVATTDSRQNKEALIAQFQQC